MMVFVDMEGSKRGERDLGVHAKGEREGGGKKGKRRGGGRGRKEGLERGFDAEKGGGGENDYLLEKNMRVRGG